MLVSQKTEKKLVVEGDGSLFLVSYISALALKSLARDNLHAFNIRQDNKATY